MNNRQGRVIAKVIVGGVLGAVIGIIVGWILIQRLSDEPRRGTQPNARAMQTVGLSEIMRLGFALINVTRQTLDIIRRI